MARLFGTDGVRGIYGHDMTEEFAYRLALFTGMVFHEDNPDGLVLIGRDTRASGESLEKAVVKGLVGAGMRATSLGIMTTPGVAYLTPQLGAVAGIVISASHNPHQYNGIKILGDSGAKLSDEKSHKIESLFLASSEKSPPKRIGKERFSVDARAAKKYADYLCDATHASFDKLTIVLDCANGAAYEIAPNIFKKLGAKVHVIGNEPDGMNINHGCGSLHPALISHAVLEHQADIGLAFDGDADRLILVDAKGNVVDGDHILAFMACHLKKHGRLPGKHVIGTTISGLGLEIALRENGCELLRAKVGDRYVLEMMEQNDANLGGEPSGHIIFRDKAITGDGLLTGIEVLAVMAETKKPLAELAATMKHLPQVSMNIPLHDNRSWQKDDKITALLQKMEQKLDGDGRLIVRASGTEPVVRVMAEGLNQEKITTIAQQVADALTKKYG